MEKETIAGRRRRREPSMGPNAVTAVLLLSCPDQKGLVAGVADFIYRQEPWLVEGLGEGLWMPSLGSVRNPRLCRALRARLEMLPNARVVEIPGAGGYVQHSAPEKCVAAWQEFIGRLSHEPKS